MLLSAVSKAHRLIELSLKALAPLQRACMKLGNLSTIFGSFFGLSLLLLYLVFSGFLFLLLLFNFAQVALGWQNMKTLLGFR
jgi:hypothetical protein